MAGNERAVPALDSNKLPKLAEAYRLALKVKETQGIDDPLELHISLGDKPVARLSMGNLTLAEEPLDPADIERLLGVRSTLRAGLDPEAIRDSLRSRLAAAPGRLRGLTGPRIKLSINPLALLAGFAFAALLLLPPWLVFQDRWLNNRPTGAIYDFFWNLLPYFNHLPLPHYFSGVVAGLIALLIAVALINRSAGDASLELLKAQSPIATPVATPVSANQRSWGWRVLGIVSFAAIALIVRAALFGTLFGFDWAAVLVGIAVGFGMLTVTPDRMRRALPKLYAAASLTFAIFAFVGLLASLYSIQWSIWIAVLLLIAAVANIWLGKIRVPPVFFVVLLALALGSLEINSWHFSVIGDEFSFYRDAVYIVQGGTQISINDMLFRGNYVYGAHPFFSTLLQAAFLKIYGISNFAWRISSIFYAAISIFFFYYFFRAFIKRPYALAAALLLAGSQYVMAFGKIGYNNLQALLAFSLVLAAAAFAVRRRDLVSYAAVGVAQAACFYVYPAALYVAPLVYILLLLYDAPKTNAARGRWAVVVAALLIVILPLFFQPDYWQSKIAGTVAFNPNVVQNTANAIEHFASNFAYTLLSPLYTVEESHFVPVGNMDIVSAALSFLGLALLLISFYKHKFLAFWLISFAMLFTLVGISHDRPTPPSTRMFMLLPHLALLAVYGLSWIKGKLRRASISALALNRAGLVLLAGIIALNVYQAYPLSFVRMTGTQNFEPAFLGTSQRYFAQPSDDKHLVLFYDPAFLHPSALTELLDVYQVPYAKSQITGIDPELFATSGVPTSLASEGSIAIADLRLPEDMRAALEGELTELGMTVCAVTNAIGDARFMLWVYPANAYLCQQTPMSAHG